MKFYCRKINTNVNIPFVDGQESNKANHEAAFDDKDRRDFFLIFIIIIINGRNIMQSIQALVGPKIECLL